MEAFRIPAHRPSSVSRMAPRRARVLSTPAVRALPVPVSELGEGPVWVPSERSLYWIDIRASVVHRWTESAGHVAAIPLPGTPGCLVPSRNGALIAALDDGLVSITTADGSISRLTAVDLDRTGGRFNDGAVDPVGRLWVGTLESTAGARNGSLYRIDPDLTWRRVLDGVGVPNGIDVSPDGHTFYFTITELGQIRAYDYDRVSGEICRERVIVQDDDCSPDGLVVDKDGMLWSAKWGGARVTQYYPDGQVHRELTLPVTNVTSLAFGGDGLASLFATTGVDEEGGATSARPEWAGRVLVVDGVGAVGRELPTFG